MGENEKIFFINDQPVGLFQEADYPNKNGKYRYRPFSGPGYFEMQKKLKNGVAPSCSFEQQGSRALFKVVENQEDGLLDIADFKIVPSQDNA